MDSERLTELGFEKSSKWKTMVLVVSFSKWWNLAIVIQCYVLFLVCLSNLSFHYDASQLTTLRYVFDVFYLFEIVFTVSYLANPQYKKLKHAYGKKWSFVTLDIVSVVPVELLYVFHHVSDHINNDIKHALFQNRLLRIYRIFQLEYFYGITVTKYSRYIVFMFILFLSKAILVAHVLCCIWVNVSQAVPCDPEKFNCVIWHETNMANLVIHNWCGKMNIFSSKPELILVLIGISLGILLIYFYFYPFIMLVSMQLNYTRILYYDKYKKLTRFLHNMIEKADVRKQNMKSFLDAWQRTSELTPLLKNIPLALKKEMCLDIYWEAFRHSELLRSVTKSCKRSLALVMSTIYLHSGDIIEFKGQAKRKMMFLIEGTIQVMAEENEKSPLLSFSSGTVIGESSLFFCVNSQAIVKCLTNCQFQTLKMRDALTVLRDYPKDKREIFHRLMQRITMAKYTQWRKNDFHLREARENLDVNSTVEDCVKWIKTHWSVIWEGQKRQRMIIKALEEGQKIPSFHQVVQPDVKIEFISNYLELIVISDVVEEKKEAVCLRTAFPWSIEPSAPFLKVWSKIVLASSFVPITVYPLCTAWLLEFPIVVYDISYVISGIFQVDLVLKLFTAVKTKHLIHTQFIPALIYKLKEPTFYLDVIAAFPSQFFIIFKYETLKAHQVGLYLHPAIFKFHLFVEMRMALGNNLDKATFLKNCLLYFYMVYLLAEGIQIYFMRYQSNDDPDADTWINRYIKSVPDSDIREYLLSAIRALKVSISIPDYIMYPDDNTAVILHCLSNYIFFFFFCYFLGNFYGAYIVRIYSQETFLVLLKRIIKFLNSINLSKKLANRLLKTVKFQWEYDNADYLSSEVPIIRSTTLELRHEVYTESAYKTLRACQMFQEESLDCLIAIMEKSFVVAVPSGSLLVSYAHTSHMISILHRGTCQINSFLAKDTVKSLAWPIMVSSGSAFPLLSSFCNVPAPVAVMTITDCELIMIHLDDLLRIFIDFNILKDVLEVLKELDFLKRLQEVKPGLIGYSSEVQPTKATAAATAETTTTTTVAAAAKAKTVIDKSNITMSQRISNIWTWVKQQTLKIVCCENKALITFKLTNTWEPVFSVYVVIVSVLWPSCFGILAYVSHIVLPILLLSKLFVVIDMFIAFRTPYYNEIGILITHPFYTFWRYLSRTFVIDFICFIPLLMLFRYNFINPMRKLPTWLVLFSFFQHFFKVLHVIEYLETLKYVLNSKYAIKMIKNVLLTLIAFNMAINFMMFYFADWVYVQPYQIGDFKIPDYFNMGSPDILEPGSLIDYYIFMCFWILSCLNTNNLETGNSPAVHRYISLSLNFIGTIFNFYLYCWVASYSIFTYLGETVFQEKIISFVKFLEIKNANDKVIEYAISYYNYEWSKTQGENLKNTFERLPTHLHEELVYPMYRRTLSRNDVFAHVDEGFYKILARYVRPVYFNRGSVILFQNEVQSDLYFLHKGKCFVYDWFLVLDHGSLFGDLSRAGVMKNKIYALTHVELLKISSDEFFRIINNFESIEVAYFELIQKLDNFLKCSTSTVDFRIHPVDSKDVLQAFGLHGKIIGFEDESYFEETEKSSVLMRKTLKYKLDDKKKLFVIYPGTWQMKAHVFLLELNAYVTIVTVPIFFSFASLTWEGYFIIGTLDFFWLVSIIASFRVGYIDKVKGDVITDFKFIAKQYLKRWDGFFVNMLALIPLELIYIGIVINKEAIESVTVSILRAPRLLRAVCLLRNFKMESRKLKTNHEMAYFHVLGYVALFFITASNVFLFLVSNATLEKVRNPYELDWDQFFGFVRSLVFVSRETSPCIIRGVLDYKFNLLEYARSENMPSFLIECPNFLRISIMKDLYFQHLRNCPLFEASDDIFLEQLLARMTREIYFSGQMIVEQNDVDHRVYFIDRGEIYVINQTKDKTSVEFVVGRLMNGESFGEAQGLWFSLPHAFTYRARTLVELLVLHSDDWMDLRRSFPQTASLILERAKVLRIV